MKRRFRCGVRILYNEPTQCICNRFRGQRRSRRHNILPSAPAAASQKLAHKLPAEVLAPRSLGRFLPKKAALQYSADDLIEYLPESCDSPVAIERLAEQLLGDGVDHHIARSGIECDYITRSRARGDGGKVRNAADVLHDSSCAGIAKYHVVEEGLSLALMIDGLSVAADQITSMRNCRSVASTASE